MGLKFTSYKSMSSIRRFAFFSANLAAGTGPYNIITGSEPTTAKEIIFARGCV